MSSRARRVLEVACLLLGTPANADVLSQWTDVCTDAAVAAKQGPFVQTRTLAMVQLAMFEAVNAVGGQYASALPSPRAAADAGSSPEAAAATAAYDVLVAVIAEQKATFDAALERSLSTVPDGKPRAGGVALGHRVAQAVIALRASDGASAPNLYRPVTTAGVYVPTALPVGVQWAKLKPWAMQSPAQFRPPAPPAMSSADWARDFNEIKQLGGKASSSRTAAQTESARFWEMTGAPAYKEVIRSATEVPGRSLVQNARLLAQTAMAWADSYVAVFDAKYTYNLWRPVTAIRNADIDGNDATSLDPGWTPLIDTPMHPEYPCAHCINVGAIVAVIEHEFGGHPPALHSTSVTLPGVTHSWKSPEDLVEEVTNARVWGGVHYRSSTAVGTAMGRKIGALVATGTLQPKGKEARR
jgi:PAP2 superfamily